MVVLYAVFDGDVPQSLSASLKLEVRVLGWTSVANRHLIHEYSYIELDNLRD